MILGFGCMDGLTFASFWVDNSWLSLLAQVPVTDVLAQQVSRPDFTGQVLRAWNNFVQTGQIWAMLIGIFIGYVYRGFTRA